MPSAPAKDQPAASDDWRRQVDVALERSFKLPDGTLSGPHTTGQDLQADWRKPRYALPSLKYFSPLKAMLAGFYALTVIANLSLAGGQLIVGYTSGTGLDVDTGTFVATGILMLFASAGAAYELRRQARRQTVVAEYDSRLSPVEAGVLIDAYSGEDEAAVLFNTLLRQKHIVIVQTQQGAIIRQTGDAGSVDTDETLFMRTLFGGDSVMPVTAVRGRLKAAQRTVARGAFLRLGEQGDLPLLGTGAKIFYFVLKAGSIVGFGISALMFLLLFDPESYVIKYPRYPVHLWQLGWCWSWQF